MMIAFIIIFIVLIVGMVGFLVVVSRKNKKVLAEAPEGQVYNTADERTTLSELPFKKIQDSMIYLGGDKYRMIIECSSINLDLMTSEEQEVVELGFQRFLQSLTFPFAFYIQTREIDNSVILEKTAKDALEVTQKFPEIEEYAKNYMQELEVLNNDEENAKIKKKYLIITYNDLASMEDIKEDEKWATAFNELESRANTAIVGLHNIGINAKILNANEIAEVVFRAYNKRGRAVLDGMLDGEMTTMTVDSDLHLRTIDKPEQLDLIFCEFFKRLETEIINDPNSPDYFVEAANQSIHILNKMRDKVGGYYKTYPTSDRNGTFEQLVEDLDNEKFML